MRHFLLLLVPIFISCTTTSNLKEFTTPPKQLYGGSFHKSYQYYVVTNVCRPAPENADKLITHICDMGIELHYFVDKPTTFVFSDISAKWGHLFEFSLAPEFKVEGENNEVSISNKVDGKWYKFEEKMIGENYLLWIRVNSELGEESKTMDIVLNVTDATKPVLAYAGKGLVDDDKESWSDIKRHLKLKK